jgi:hypothetical protein
LTGAVIFSGQAFAGPILDDPIVRVRGGGTSIPITGLPFFFDFGNFPDDPDGELGPDCSSGPGTGDDAGFTVVSCGFQNLTGLTISLLDFSFSVETDGTFFVQDPDNFFDNEFIKAMGAQFAGGGIPSGSCDGGPDLQIEGVICFGGEFIIDLVGFAPGTHITMVATQVPEPVVMALFGVAVIAAAGARRRRRL